MTESTINSDNEIVGMSLLQRIRRDLIKSRTANSEARKGKESMASGGKTKKQPGGRSWRTRGSNDNARDHVRTVVDDDA